MKNKITVKDFLEITNGKLVIGNEKDVLEKFCYDTRELKINDIYIGLKGEKIDGSTLWKMAFDQGAKAVIVQNINFENENIENYKLQGKIIILVEDTLKALGQIAKYKRELYNIPVVGVTGSVGKTSTKDIIASVVSQKYKTLKTEGNNNNHIGLPSTILRLDNEEAAVIEMGMNHLGEIELLSNISKPTLAVITNIGTSHIGNLGSRENILKAKLEILESMDKKIIVINNDNDLLHQWYLDNKENYHIITYGINNESDYMAEEMLLNENSSSFVCQFQNEKISINVPVGGEHFVYNSLCAVAIGKCLKLNNEEIITGIQKFELTKKRMEIIQLKSNITLINDTYNASFESIRESLKYIKNIEKGRKIAVLGDVLELGNFAEQLHKQIGKEVVNQGIDILICSGPNAKYICEAAIESGMKKENIYYENNIADVEKRIEKEMQSDDIVLLKASNGMKFAQIAMEIINKYKI